MATKKKTAPNNNTTQYIELTYSGSFGNKTPLLTGRNLLSLPVRNSEKVHDKANEITRWTIKNIQNRKLFNNGTDFVASVADGIQVNYDMPRSSALGYVYRVLARYFV